MRAGYKRTEVGVIPEEWEVRKLGEIAEIKGGKRIPKDRSLLAQETPYPYIRVSDMYYGGVNLAEIRYVPIDVFPSIRNYRIYAEDIFMSVAGTLGVVGKVPKELDGANLTENADRITNITCEQDYLLYYLTFSKVQDLIQNEKTVAAQPKLALTRIKGFLIALPPSRREQQAIAAALSDVDALISSLDKLIAKKRDIKQAAMQQLLTGRRRLPGFYGEWEKRRLGDITELRKERIDPQADGAGEFCVELEHIASGAGQLMGDASASSQVSMKSIFHTGDVLFGKLRAYLRKYWLADRGGVCSTEFWVLAANHQIVIPEFLFYLVATEEFISMASMAYGTHMPRSDWNLARDYRLELPGLDEQRAIASVLSDMDAEIEALERRRDKTRLLKQGMMQELLTGRVRLV